MIRASRYNDLIDGINHLWSTGYGDSGYGQIGTELSRVEKGDRIRSDDWIRIESVLNQIEQHQTGRERQIDPRIALGKRFEIDLDLTEQRYHRLFENRLIAHTRSTRLLGTMRRNEPRRGNQPDQISGMYQIGFENTDHAGYFFNTGGFLQLALHQRRLRTDSDRAWTFLFDHHLGSILFHADHCLTTGGLTSNIGYYNLTHEFQPLLVARFDTDRSVSVDVRIDGIESNGRPGNLMTFRIILNDQSVGGFDMLTSGTKLVITGHKSVLFDSLAFPSGSVYDGWN